ncbi:MAG: hypothetical protein GYA36_17360 [Veillonellaceae bacterium]|nr:hypothetical protein [Veillonellaceae bacterium]
MTCQTAYATITDYDHYLCAQLDLNNQDVVDTVTYFLDMASADIAAALAAVGACDCTLAPWAVQYLKKLTVIEAAVLQTCPCGVRMSEDQRQLFLDWVNKQLELIRQGKIVLCQGETSADYPAIDWAELNWTDWSAATIISNQQRRIYGLP